MVYNGEVYNYRELRAELEAAGETFTGHSDSQVVLALFPREGARCFTRLNGIFFFGVLGAGCKYLDTITRSLRGQATDCGWVRIWLCIYQ